MYYQVLKNLIISKGLSKAGLAKQCRLTRAAVTNWFKKGSQNNFINIETRTLCLLAKALDVSPDILLQKREPLDPFKTNFLWDALYPNMESFVKALIENRPMAMARLVQTLGFFEAKKIIGSRCIKEFNLYKKYMKPIRRQQLELLWPLYN